MVVVTITSSCLRQDSQKGELPGSLFFMAVPDEESYSAGMRAGAQVLREFKRKYDLDYKLLLKVNAVTANLNILQFAGQIRAE